MREAPEKGGLGARLKGLAATLWDAPAATTTEEKPAKPTKPGKPTKQPDPIYIPVRWGEQIDGVALFVDDDTRTRYLARGAMECGSDIGGRYLLLVAEREVADPRAAQHAVPVSRVRRVKCEGEAVTTVAPTPATGKAARTANTRQTRTAARQRLVARRRVS